MRRVGFGLGWKMRLVCERGFYKFYPEYAGEVKLFQRKFGYSLYPCRDFYTFKALAEFPDYSFIGHPIGNSLQIGIVNYAGRPEDVLSENKLTHAPALGRIVNIALANINSISYSENDAYITMSQIPQAFARINLLKVASGFSGFANVKNGKISIERFFTE